MRTDISLLIVLALALAACSQSRAESANTGELAIDLAIAPDPPTTGANTLTVKVRDAAGKPVDGATLDLVIDMPAMGAMPEMKTRGKATALGNGAYAINYPLPMMGDWYLTLRVAAPGHPSQELHLRIAPPRQGFTIEKSDEAPTSDATLRVSPARQQLIGLTWATAAKKPLTLELRAPARVDVDESQLAEVVLKYDAYIEKLFVSKTGQSVKKGQPLLTFYSPDLLAAEQDYLLARRNVASGTAGGEELLRAAEQKLQLWDLSAEQIAELARKGKAEPRITIVAPASGVVLEKSVLEGTRVMAGTTLYKIGNLGRVWVLADFFPADAQNLAVGQKARLEVRDADDATREGRVEFIYPTVDPKTRTLTARVSFDTGELHLRPGMFVEVTVEVPLGDKLVIPDSAVLISGEHRYVFVERGPGKLQAVEVRTGARSGDDVEVLSGVSAGERVALGATFLLSSEAQLHDALPRWSAP